MALQNQTFANSGSSYYGNPADWSKFSTLTSTIRFNDTDATIVVIPAVPDSATTITFNGEQLAYVSDVPDLANWAQYPANHDVIIAAPYVLNVDTAFISTLSVYQQTIDTESIITSTLTVTERAFISTATISSLNVINSINTSLLENSTITILANNQNFPLESPALNITSKNGLGGNITLTADSGTGFISGGLITLESKGGTGLLGLNGAIDLVAESGDSAVVGVTTGGRIDITAESGINDLFLTSAIKLSAAGINIQSGVTSPITSVLGYTFIGGNLGVNSCAGIPAIIPNVPGENYIYGLNGIVLDGDVYTSDIYPKWDGVSNPDDLILHGRTVNIGFGPYNAMVELENVSQIAFESSGFRTGGAITGFSSINGLNTGATGSIQYSDGVGAFQGNSNLKYNGTSRITNSNGNNFIDINDVANANSIAIQTPNQVNITANPLIGINSAEALYLTAGTFLKVDIANSTGTSGQILTSDGLYANWQDPPLSGFIDSFQIYVAPNGNNTTGTGSQQNPYLTIARAITKRATLAVATEVSIILSSGTYTESFTLLRNTFLIGIPTGEQNQPCNVVGSIAMNTITNQVGIAGLQVTGPSTGTLDTVRCLGTGGTYSIYNCNITGTVGNAINFFEGSGFLTECRITGAATTHPAIDADAGSTVIIRDCTISNPTTNVASVITSTGTITFHNSIIQSLNTTSTVLQPIIQFSSSTTPESIEMNYCQIKYANTLTDTGGAKCCIRFTNSNAVVKTMVYCLLLCEGATTAVGGQIQCIQKTGTGTVTLTYGSLLAGATAHHIAPTITKTQLISVP
jgi:hypothetical protein